MIFSYEEAVNSGLFEDAVIITLYGKDKPLHEGHLRLIEYASQFGSNIVVCVLSEMRRWFSFLEFGSYNTDIPNESISTLCNALETLGLPVVIKGPIPNLSEEFRFDAMEKSHKNVEFFKDQIYLDRIAKVCKFLFADILLRTKVYGNPKVKLHISGPEVEGFVIKACVRHSHAKALGTNYSGTLNVYPNLVKDASTGLRFKATRQDLSQNQMSLLPSLGNLIQQTRDRYQKGNNISLVEELNNTYKNDLFKFHEIVVFEDGIFENFRLELVVFFFPEEIGSHLVEDLNVVIK